MVLMRRSSAGLMKNTNGMIKTAESRTSLLSNDWINVFLLAYLTGGIPFSHRSMTVPLSPRISYLALSTIRIYWDRGDFVYLQDAAHGLGPPKVGFWNR